MRGPVAFVHDVLPGGEVMNSHRQALDSLTLLVREAGDDLQLADEPGCGVRIGGRRHVVIRHFVAGGSAQLSQPSAPGSDPLMMPLS